MTDGKGSRSTNAGLLHFMLGVFLYATDWRIHLPKQLRGGFANSHSRDTIEITVEGKGSGSGWIVSNGISPST